MSDKIKELEEKKEEAKTPRKRSKTLSAYDLAKDILDEKDKDLIYCTSWDRFLIYNGKYFELVDKNALNAYILKVLEDQKHEKLSSVKPSDINNTVGLMQMKCTNKVNDLELNHDYIAFNDGLYNTITHQLEPHTNEILCFKYIDVSSEDFEKPMPNFDNFLRTTIVYNKPDYPTDFETISLYQEMLGSLFSGNRQANRAFFLKGEGANGKSVSTDLILSFFDEDYTCTASIKSFTEKFGKTQLIGKLVNVNSEEESKHIFNDSFKALITGDKTNDQWKNGAHVDFHNYAKFIFGTNNPPSMSDYGYALQRRIVIIPFNRVFKPEERDHNLPKKLQEEKAPIIGWALKGLQRLQENNFELSISKSVQLELEKYETESASVLLFLEEEYDIDHESYENGYHGNLLKAGGLYEEYSTWCKANGHKAMTKVNMSKAIARSSMYSMYTKEYQGQTQFFLKKKLEDAPSVVEERNMTKEIYDQF